MKIYNFSTKNIDGVAFSSSPKKLRELINYNLTNEKITRIEYLGEAVFGSKSEIILSVNSLDFDGG